MKKYVVQMLLTADNGQQTTDNRQRTGNKR